MQTFRRLWLQISISSKFKLMIATLYLMIFGASIFNIYIMNAPMKSAGKTLEEITRCARVEEALQKEEVAFRAYLQEPTQENEKRFETACVRSKSVVSQLPYDYESMGKDRYARTWNLKNGYEAYAAQRDRYTEQYTKRGSSQIQKLYTVYDTLDYLQQYIQVITQLTVEDGSVTYEKAVPMLQSMPYIQVIISIVMLIVAMGFGRGMSETLILPLQKLAQAARRIGENDFSGEDITVENNDEVGEFVTAFNSMKHATESSITTLRENQKLEERLHREAVERIELENRLESTKLDLLQSQINPHFLFNTLNTIAGMAELEEADGTNRMIRALSNIFRYNLRTADAFVTLQQELNICEDYIYLQKMRFEYRLQYKVVLSGDVSADAITVPVHILQPLVENAVIHGVLKKEQGGTVTVRISGRENICIRVEDTGCGIPKEKLDLMLAELEAGGELKHVGIGVGNVYRRMRSIYPDGQIELESTEGVGTCVTIVFPYRGRD